MPSGHPGRKCSVDRNSLSVYPDDMTTVHPSSVDIAGTAWPVYKLEALAAALVTGVLLGLILGSPQVAVLAAAAVAAVRWIVGAYAARRAAPVRPVRVPSLR